jgi:plasmid stabilization system protein ParE
VTFQIIVSREGHGDIAEAITEYRAISPALSERFGAELERVYSYITEYPEMYPVIYKNFRRALLHKFPYSVFYLIEPPTILIVGVVHQSRDEATWKRRA